MSVVDGSVDAGHPQNARARATAHAQTCESFETSLRRDSRAPSTVQPRAILWRYTVYSTVIQCTVEKLKSFRSVFFRGCYGDFEKLNTSEIDCTTTQNMCLGVPKRPGS